MKTLLLARFGRYKFSTSGRGASEAGTTTDTDDHGSSPLTVSTPTEGQSTDEQDSNDVASRRLAGDSDAAPSRRSRLTALVVLGVLPAVVLILSGVVGFLKWNFDNAREARTAAVESIQAASDSTVKMLSYQPSTVEQDLASAEDGMTGVFRDEYVKLTHDVVIPGAKEKNIAAVAKVAAASSVSATGDHAVVLVFVNQTVTVGSDPPTNTASSVRVTVNKHGNRWLISAFEPV